MNVIKTTLSPAENFNRMMEGRDPERLPLNVPLTPPVADRMEQKRGTRDPVKGLGSDFREFSVAGNGVTPKEWRDGYASAGIRLPENAEVDSNGVVHVRPAHGTGEAYHFRQLHHALGDLETVEELERLPWGPTDYSGYTPKHRERVSAAKAEGLTTVGSRECTIFEQTWYLRSMDQLFCDLIEGDPVGGWLLDRFTARSISDVRDFCEMGVDVIALGDDIGMQTGMMMSVPFWREHLKSRLAKVIRAIRDLRGDDVRIMYHSDGNITEVIPDLLEIGIDILNPVQPECIDVTGTLSAYKHDCAFWGMLGTQSILPHGSPDDVRAAIRHLADLAREGCRIVAAPTHVLEPDVPWENIEALDEVFRIRL